MARLRKYTMEELWRILYNVRQEHESDSPKGGLFGIIANLMLGQQAIIGILNRQKKEQEKNEPRQTYGNVKLSVIYTTRYEPQERVWDEEATNASHPQDSYGHPVTCNGPRGG